MKSANSYQLTAGGCSFTRSGKEPVMARVKKQLTQLTPQLMSYVEKCSRNTTIEPELYEKYNVKRGLREKDGKGEAVLGNHVLGPAVVSGVDNTAGANVGAEGHIDVLY